LQPIRQAPDRGFADGLDFEKIDDPLDIGPVLELLLLRRTEVNRLLQKVAAHP
jgi:hypothetical protein